MKSKLRLSLFLGVFVSLLANLFPLAQAYGADLLTNAAHFSNAPKWLNSTRVNRVVDKIQSYLEWSIRRVEVVWYADSSEFARAHGLGQSLETIKNLHMQDKE